MARFRKALLAPGRHISPDGVVDATPARLKRWADTFKRMKQRGIKIPIPWGHQPEGLPCENEAEFQLSVSRYNAGYMEDLYVDPATGELVFEGDCPGVEVGEDGSLLHWVELPDGRRVKSAISEVSAGIQGWRSGDGTYWDDAIVHVALTPLPVWANQTGFRKMSTTQNRIVRLAPSTKGVQSPSGKWLSSYRYQQLQCDSEKGCRKAKARLKRLGWVEKPYKGRKRGMKKWVWDGPGNKSPRYETHNPSVKRRKRKYQPGRSDQQRIDSLQEKLARIYHDVKLTDEEKESARRALQALLSKHGRDGVVDAIADKARGYFHALSDTKEEKYRRKLKGLDYMLVELENPSAVTLSTLKRLGWVEGPYKGTRDVKKWVGTAQDKGKVRYQKNKPGSRKVGQKHREAFKSGDLTSKLSKVYGDVNLTDKDKGDAARALKALQRHHGENVEDAIRKKAGEYLRAMMREDAPVMKEKWKRKLKGLSEMLGMVGSGEGKGGVDEIDRLSNEYGDMSISSLEGLRKRTEEKINNLKDPEHFDSSGIRAGSKEAANVIARLEQQKKDIDAHLSYRKLKDSYKPKPKRVMKKLVYENNDARRLGRKEDTVKSYLEYRGYKIAKPYKGMVHVLDENNNVISTMAAESGAIRAIDRIMDKGKQSQDNAERERKAQDVHPAEGQKYLKSLQGKLSPAGNEAIERILINTGMDEQDILTADQFTSNMTGYGKSDEDLKEYIWDKRRDAVLEIGFVLEDNPDLTQSDINALEKAVNLFGGEFQGKPGDVVPFHGLEHTSDQPVAKGDPVRIKLPGIFMPGHRGGDYQPMRARVTPAGAKQPPASTADTAAPKEKPASRWESARGIIKELRDENSRFGGFVKIPDVVDRIKEQHPDMDTKQVHDLLQQWQKEGKLTLQLNTAPEREPRGAEGIESNRGLLFYIHLRDEGTSTSTGQNPEGGTKQPADEIQKHLADFKEMRDSLKDLSFDEVRNRVADIAKQPSSVLRGILEGIDMPATGSKQQMAKRLLGHLEGIKTSIDQTGRIGGKEQQSAEDIQNIANSVAGRGTSNAFISHVWEEFRKSPAGKGVSREQFNEMLLKAHQQGKLKLKRADNVELMDINDVKDSEIKSPYAEFHFIRPSEGRSAGGTAAPKEMNREQFLKSKGVTFDPMSEGIALDSPSGSMSKRARSSADKRFKEEFQKYSDALDEYQRKVDSGEIIDPSGRHTKTKDKDRPEYRKAKQDIESLIRHNEDMYMVGKGAKGKLRPKYQKVVDRNNEELQRIFKEYPDLAEQYKSKSGTNLSTQKKRSTMNQPSPVALSLLKYAGITRLSWVEAPYKGKRDVKKWFGKGEDDGKVRYQKNMPGSRKKKGEDPSETKRIEKTEEELQQIYGEVELTNREMGSAKAAITRLKKKHGEGLEEAVKDKAQEYLHGLAGAKTDEEKLKFKKKLKGLSEALKLHQTPATEEKKPAKGKAKAERVKPPKEPTAAAPGSEEKIRAMEERVKRGEGVFHPDDGMQPKAKKPEPKKKAEKPKAENRTATPGADSVHGHISDLVGSYDRSTTIGDLKKSLEAVHGKTLSDPELKKHLLSLSKAKKISVSGDSPDWNDSTRIRMDQDTYRGKPVRDYGKPAPEEGVKEVINSLPETANGMLKISDIRKAVEAKYGKDAAHRQNLDKQIQRLRRDGEVSLIAISDQRKASKEELNNAIPGAGETLFYLKKKKTENPKAESRSRLPKDMTQGDVEKFLKESNEAYKGSKSDYQQFAESIGLTASGTKANMKKQVENYLNGIGKTLTQTDFGSEKKPESKADSGKIPIKAEQAGKAAFAIGNTVGKHFRNGKGPAYMKDVHAELERSLKTKISPEQFRKIMQYLWSKRAVDLNILNERYFMAPEGHLADHREYAFEADGQVMNYVGKADEEKINSALQELIKNPSVLDQYDAPEIKRQKSKKEIEEQEERANQEREEQETPNAPHVRQRILNRELEALKKGKRGPAENRRIDSIEDELAFLEDKIKGKLDLSTRRHSLSLLRYAGVL